MNSVPRRTAFLAAVFCLFPLFAAEAVLTLDSDFDTDGFARVDFAANLDSARDLAEQADGRVVLVGLSRQGNFDYLGVARLDEDGSLDEDFGTDGTTALLPGGTPMNFGGADGKAVAIQPVDQKIVIAGTWNVNDGSGFQAMVVRLLTDGTPDPDFGTGGTSLVSLPGIFNAVVETVSILDDGNILIAGGCNTSGCVKGFVARLTEDGDLDTNFGSGGVYSIANPAEEGGSIAFQSITPLAGDKILLVGGNHDVIVVRLLANGTPDNTFSGDGIATFNYSFKTIGEFQLKTYEEATSVVVLSDGRLLIAGSSMDPTNNDRNAMLMRTTAAGALDTGFGTDGWFFLPNSNKTEAVFDIVQRPSGDFVIAGLGFKPTQVSFNASMTATLSAGFPPQAINGLIVLDDGRVVGAGEENVAALDYRFVAVRFDATDLEEPDCEACGELSGDCRVTAADALSALKMAVGQVDDDPRADYNGDGDVTAADALAILKVAIGSLAPSDACKA